MERLTRKNPLTESQAMNLSLTDLYMRLKTYEDAEEQGRLIVLPCKVGTPVWSTAFCKVNDDGTEEPTEWLFDAFMISEWGTAWFLTREEAEKALEGMG